MNKREEQIRYANNQLIDQNNLDVVVEMFSSDYIAHAGEKTYKGQKFIKQFAKQVRSAIPDIKIFKVEFLAQAGNIITWQRTFRGTHKADMMGIPASEKKIKWYDIVVTRFEGNKIAEEWVASDLASQLLLKQPSKK